MPSYYEVLKLDSNASIEVIEAAIDDQYNQFRRLVNHHDPNVVEQANRALRQLEDIRSTLTNSEKRALYDQKLIGGLVDPNAILQSMGVGTVTITPPPPQTAGQDDPRVYAWKCSQCGTANRIDSTTCSGCGTIIARDCPNGCGSVVRLSERYCSKCGKSVEEGLTKMQLEFEQAQKQFCDGLRADIRLKRNKIERLNWFVGHPLKKRSELAELVGKHIDYKPNNIMALILVTVVTVGFIGFALYGGQGALIGLICGGWIGAPFVALVMDQVDVKPRVRTIIEHTADQYQADILHTERRLQEEQAKQFDPLSPRPYSVTTN